VFLDPTLVVDEFGEVSSPDAGRNDPNNQYLSVAFVEENLKYWKDPIFEIPADLRAAAVEAFHKQQKFVGLCNQAGARIIAGTDGPSIGRLMAGFGLHRELELLIGSGLSPLQALRAATITAAEALGRENDLGTIERGKLADIVVVNGDPLEDLQNLRKIHMVIEGGKAYSPEGLLHQVRSQENESSEQFTHPTALVAGEEQLFPNSVTEELRIIR